MDFFFLLVRMGNGPRCEMAQWPFTWVLHVLVDLGQFLHSWALRDHQSVSCRFSFAKFLCPADRYLCISPLITRKQCEY